MFLILFDDLTGVSLVVAAALAANIMDKYVKKYESIFPRYLCVVFPESWKSSTYSGVISET